MRTIRLLLATAGVCALAACGGSGPAGTEQTVAPVAQTTEAVTPRHQAYLDALAEIDAGLVVNAERALRRAERICAYPGEGHTEAQTVDYTVAELSGGNATIDKGQAKKILKLARKYVCDDAA